MGGRVDQYSEARIAVIGAGLIGRKHVELVARHARLEAVVDPAPAARDVATAHGAHWFAGLSECLDTVRPDAAIIASPNGVHLEHAKLCLDAGFPVLIEKPLADSVAAGRAIVERAGSTGVPVLVGHHRRHSPVVDAAHAIIQEGRLGRVVAVNAMFWLHKPDDYFNMSWRTKPGGGPLYINLIHDIDLLQHLCGPIRSVQARETSDVRGFEVEDTSAVILSFENGALGTVTISDTVSAPWSWELTSGENPAYPKTDQSCYMIGGTEGSLSMPDLRVWSHVGLQSWWSPIEAKPFEITPTDPVAAQFRHFLDIVEGRAAPRVTAEDGLRNIMVLEAIKTATSTGGTVPVG